MGIEAVDARTLLTLCDLQSRRGIPRQVCHGMFATSEKFGVKVKRAYCRDNFLAQRPLPDMCRLSGDDFLCFNRTAPRRIENTTLPLSWSEREREMRETLRRLSACVPVRGTFRARILTILRPSVISNQQSRETVAGTSASITVSSVTTLNRTF